MYTIPESFRTANAVRAPVSFPAADNNRHTANCWSNYLPESLRVRNYYAPSYAAFPVANCRVSSFPATKSSHSSAFVAGAASFPKAGKSKEVISFHSSTKWREYFQASKQSNKLIVIYFTATWCGPCQAMEPTIKELAAKYIDVELVKIDVDELFDVSSEYGIQTLPTFLFMKNGKEIDKVAGARKEALQRKIEIYRAN